MSSSSIDHIKALKSGDMFDLAISTLTDEDADERYEQWLCCICAMETVMKLTGYCEECTSKLTVACKSTDHKIREKAGYIRDQGRRRYGYVYGAHYRAGQRYAQYKQQLRQICEEECRAVLDKENSDELIEAIEQKYKEAKIVLWNDYAR